MSSDVVVAVENLSKRYFVQSRPIDQLRWRLFKNKIPESVQHWALKDISFELKRGETLGIMGRNGCGKSTLLQTIVGTVSPTTGRVEVRGELAALLELGAGFSPELSGRENVYVYGSLLGMSDATIQSNFDEIVAFAELENFIEEPVKTYSHGMFLRLAFSVAVNATPEILVIDEVLAVGDEAFQRRCFARIEELKQSGVSLLLVSHAAGTVLELCDRVLLIDRGEALLLGEPRDVVRHYHRLIYAPHEEQEAIRTDILLAEPMLSDPTELPKKLEASESSAAPARPLDKESFDPGLQSKSLLEYVSRGARIEDYTIRSASGSRVNVLQRGGLYFVDLSVLFDKEAFGVRFGMLVKTVVGTELGGIVSSPPGRGIEHVRAGTSLTVRLPFRPRLSSDTYFTNVGVVGLSEDGEIFLHRISDALVFRVLREQDSIITSSVDLSSGQETTIKEQSKSGE
ncbi:MAG: ABC transporter ATP-binding protein [Myxococcota bacterium]